MNQDTNADNIQLWKKQMVACKMHSDISGKCCENVSILTALLLDMIFCF